MGEIVRKRVMHAIQQLFEARQEGVNGATITWDKVVRAPLSKLDKHMPSNIIGITSGVERPIKRDTTETRILTVMIEFEAKTLLGEPPEDFGIDVLADVQHTISNDNQLGGLVLHMYEAENTLDVDSESDRSIGGIILYDVTYRHMFDDPYKLVGE